MEVAGDPDRPAVVAEVALDRAGDARHGVGGEGGPTLGSKPSTALTSARLATCSRSSSGSELRRYRRASCARAGGSAPTSTSRSRRAPDARSASNISRSRMRPVAMTPPVKSLPDRKPIRTNPSDLERRPRRRIRTGRQVCRPTPRANYPPSRDTKHTKRQAENLARKPHRESRCTAEGAWSRHRVGCHQRRARSPRGAFSGFDRRGTSAVLARELGAVRVELTVVPVPRLSSAGEVAGVTDRLTLADRAGLAAEGCVAPSVSACAGR